MVIRVMAEDGFDLSNKKSKSVFELFKEGKIYEYVITVCHDTELKCPISSGITKCWHWPFPDSTAVEGTEAEKLEEVRKIRDIIKNGLLNPPENTINFDAVIEK